jgi:hypothetical protein
MAERVPGIEQGQSEYWQGNALSTSRISFNLEQETR